MKRITHLKIHNYRAFWGVYDIPIPKGENLLIYGENGSGKSSIYKALKDFFASSENPKLQFWRNVYAPVPANAAADGTIEVVFNNYPVSENSIGAIYNFSNIPSIRDAQTESFIKKANKAKAFLSYQELVKSYILKSDGILSPNLFDLILNLIEEEEFGDGKVIKQEWQRLNDWIQKDGRGSDFKFAKKGIPVFEDSLKEKLIPILLKTNDYLATYFKSGLLIDLERFYIRPIKKNRKWSIDSELCLKVKLFENDIVNGYQNHLNEARLSAIAICVYLSAIKLNPQPDDYKIVFLDDVFIGLDTSNRLPLLELLKAEFPDHQVFISTYDRFWYETAKRWFDSNMTGKWKNYEMYVNHREHLPGKNFDKPILTTVSTNWEKGVYYLQHETNPDYPAAANSFRKFFEELLSKYFPEYEFRQANNEKIESYKLSKLTALANDVLIKIGAANTFISELISALPTLLHPLSHFEISTPLYKGELLKIRDNLNLLETQLLALDIKNKYKNAREKNLTVRLHFVIDANRKGFFELKLDEHLCKFSDNSHMQFTTSKCHYTETYILNGSNCENKYSFTKKTTKHFSSLQEAYLMAHAHIITEPKTAFSSIQQMPDYLDAFDYCDDGVNWFPLKQLL